MSEALRHLRGRRPVFRIARRSSSAVPTPSFRGDRTNQSPAKVAVFSLRLAAAGALLLALGLVWNSLSPMTIEVPGLGVFSRASLLAHAGLVLLAIGCWRWSRLNSPPGSRRGLLTATVLFTIPVAIDVIQTVAFVEALVFLPPLAFALAGQTILGLEMLRLSVYLRLSIRQGQAMWFIILMGLLTLSEAYTGFRDMSTLLDGLEWVRGGAALLGTIQGVFLFLLSRQIT